MASQHPDFEPQASQILSLIEQLQKALRISVSFDWEQDYHCRDLSAKVVRLEAELAGCVPLIDWATVASQPRTGLETAHEKEILYLEGEVKETRRMAEDLKARLDAAEGLLDRLRPKLWELAYQCRDLSEEVWRLKMHLRNTVDVDSFEDVSQEIRRGLQPVTALEVALQHRVEELDREVQTLKEDLTRPKRRGRSRTM